MKIYHRDISIGDLLIINNPHPYIGLISKIDKQYIYISWNDLILSREPIEKYKEWSGCAYFKVKKQ